MENTENKNEQQDELENVENSLGKTEQYIEKNKEKLLMAVGIVVLIVVGVMAYIKLVKTPKENNASAQMFMAEKYMERDSFNLALNGDGNYPGFLGIIDKFSGTAAANNAKYYAGICYMHNGDFDNAIKMLDGFSSSDPNLEPESIGLLGDAYMEKGDAAKAQKQYEKAVSKAENNVFLAPFYLQKLGICCEKQNDFEGALKAYEKIKTNYPTSYEGRNAEKNIAAMNLKLGK